MAFRWLFLQLELSIAESTIGWITMKFTPHFHNPSLASLRLFNYLHVLLRRRSYNWLQKAHSPIYNWGNKLWNRRDHLPFRFLTTHSLNFRPSRTSDNVFQLKINFLSIKNTLCHLIVSSSLHWSHLSFSVVIVPMPSQANFLCFDLTAPERCHPVNLLRNIRK